MKWTLRSPGPVKPVVAQFDLPYCLHLQNGAYAVVVEDQPYEVIHEKIWQNSENCSQDDGVYDQAILFETGTVTSGKIGQDPEEARRRIGTNVEISEDAQGEFRFSRVSVGLFAPAESEPDLDALLDEALSVVNRLVDVFRYVSGRAYLPPVQINDVRFVEWVWPLSGEMAFDGRYGKGLKIAVINESRAVHERLRTMLASRAEVPLYAELLLTARRTLDASPRQAVVEGVSALQVFVESVLKRGVESGKISNDELESLREGRLSDVMKDPFRRILGWSPADDSTMWAEWLAANRLRRSVVHQGYKPTLEDAGVALRVVEKLTTATESKLLIALL